ncbi:MAG TPA: S53 family peptidase [Polyangia bacterium]|nr:S53 family peptidase [Polyangia bacterium]
MSTAAALPACSHDGPSAPTAQVPNAASALPLSRPAWAQSQYFVGRAPSTDSLALQVHLRLRNEAQAEAELAAISAPGSQSYGKFLSDADYDAKYGPTDADIAAVRALLEANGMTVTYVPTNRTYVAATATVAQAEAAFGTALGNYRVGTETRRAPMGAIVLPAALQSRVAQVMGLASPVVFGPHFTGVSGAIDRGTLAPNADASPVPADACSEWYGAYPDVTDPAYPGYPALTYAPCGYKPAQLRRAYGFEDAIRAGNDGTGQKIAIVDAYLSPTLFQDAQTYAANNDADYPLTAAQFTAQYGPPGTPIKVSTGWYGEQTLDVEAIHAMAPGATINYVGAQSANDADLVASINFIIANKLATIVSNSYGSPEGQANDFVVWHSLATQAGLKGVGLYFSSGDDGDEVANLGFASADFPASLDNATAVGGTSLALNADGSRLFETGWESGRSALPAPDADAGVTTPTWTPAPPGAFDFGAGGGTSMVYEQPAWQVGVVPTAIANLPGAPARAVPDVAMLADPVTGFVVGQTSPRGTKQYKESVIGGTSLACPLFSATMILAQQKAGHAFGFANAALYKARKKAFTDVVPLASPQAVSLAGGVAFTFQLSGLAIDTLVGWDNVTGLGTPAGASFLAAMK